MFNVTIIILQVTVFSIFQASPQCQLHIEINTFIKLVFPVAILSSMVHLLLYIIKCCSNKKEAEIQEEETKIIEVMKTVVHNVYNSTRS